MTKIGILLTNTGTPHSPTTPAVKKYLREFLSDKRIVHIPHLIWLPILYGFILPFRSKKSAALYQKIWTPDGSPMKIYMDSIQQKLSASLPDANIQIGMNYGKPSIKHALTVFHKQHIEKIIVLPIYPQYSNTTAASTYDRLHDTIKKWPHLPHLTFIRSYATDSAYINALAESITTYWEKHGKGEHLLISYHGLPKRFIEKGDPYQQQCEVTTALLANKLHLKKEQFTLCYQSQFGYDKWLQPSTQTLLKTLPKNGIKHCDIICPGFSVDCLETLEEIAITGRESFLHAGGESLHYIPALNDDDAHITLFHHLLTASI